MLFLQYLEGRLCARPPLGDLLAELRERPGKHLRPRLYLLSSRPERLAAAAVHIPVGLELLHLASLVHDDLIDGSFKRRGRKTLWESRGSQSALLCGDYLFSEGFAEFEASGIPGVMPQIRLLVAGMVQAEIEQDRHRFDLTVGEPVYWRRINLKTARFFALSASLGAAASGSDAKEVSSYHKFGRSFGIAYQLADDLRDVLNGDLNKGVISLPVLWLARESKYGARLIGRICRNRRVRSEDESTLYKLLDEEGILFRTGRTIDRFLRQSAGYLREMDPWNRERLRQFLSDLRPFLLQMPEYGEPGEIPEIKTKL